jgi:hypothetical protein
MTLGVDVEAYARLYRVPAAERRGSCRTAGLQKESGRRGAERGGRGDAATGCACKSVALSSAGRAHKTRCVHGPVTFLAIPPPRPHHSPAVRR